MRVHVQNTRRFQGLQCIYGVANSRDERRHQRQRYALHVFRAVAVQRTEDVSGVQRTAATLNVVVDLVGDVDLDGDGNVELDARGVDAGSGVDGRATRSPSKSTTTSRFTLTRASTVGICCRTWLVTVVAAGGFVGGVAAGAEATHQ